MGKPKRRLRATFLLKCVILLACAALFAGVVSLGMGIGWTIGSLVFAAVLWYLVIETQLLPLVIERIAVRRAARSGKPVSSIWFVDHDQEDRRERENFHDEMEDFHDDTRENPTIR